MEIHGLLSLEESDVVAWMAERRRLAQNCAWTDSTAVATLKAIVGPKILDIIGTKRTVETIEQAMLLVKFPKHKRLSYLNELDRIKQQDYVLIQHYKEDLGRIFEEYCFCSQIKPLENQHRFEELFFKGLHPVLGEITLSHGLTTIEQVMTHVSAIEEFLLQHRGNKDKPRIDQEPKTFRQDDKEKDQTQSGGSRLKFCKKHGNCMHTSNECRALKGNDPTKFNKKNSAYIIREPP